MKWVEDADGRKDDRSTVLLKETMGRKLWEGNYGRMQGKIIRKESEGK